MPYDLRCRRAYEAPSAEDGSRVLVDRLWPRGLAKADAELDDWLKSVAPSDELRHWYGHDPERFEEFQRRYRTELDASERSKALDRLREYARQGTVTLLTATKEVSGSHLPTLVERVNEE